VIEYIDLSKNLMVLLFNSNNSGISLPGFIIGSIMVLTLTTKKRGIPSWKFLDYVSLSFLSVFPWLFLFLYFNTYIFIIYTFTFSFFYFVLFPRYARGTVKDGTITLLFLIMFSLISVLNDVVSLYKRNTPPSIEVYIYIIIFLFSSLFLIRNQLKSSR
jgi:hypothetical protein